MEVAGQWNGLKLGGLSQSQNNRGVKFTLFHSKIYVKIFWTNFLELISTPLLRCLIHGRYREEGEQQQQQFLGSEEIQSSTEGSAAEPNVKAQVGDSSQQNPGSLAQQQPSEVRLPIQALLLADRSCVLLLVRAFLQGYDAGFSEQRDIVGLFQWVGVGRLGL